MKATGNTITINTLVRCEFKEVPVMRNGKATKRTKQIIEDIYEDVELQGIEVEGHEVFIKKSHIDNLWYCHKADGEPLLCNCKFGRYGEANHKEAVLYNDETNEFAIISTGYNGATMRGAGAIVKNIIWE